MREALAPAALLGGFLAVGEATLVALGFVRDRADALRAAGMAIVVGWSIVLSALSVALTVGVAPTPSTALVAGVLACGAVGALFLSARPVAFRRRPLREATWRGRLVALAGAFVLLGYALALLLRSWEPTGVLHADVWNQWLPKAKIIYFFGGLDTGVGGYTSQLNPDYPPLHPASEALVFHVVGDADPLVLARVHWAFAVAFILAVAWVLAPHVRPAFLWPCLAMLMLAPRFGRLVGSSLADEPLAMFVALAGLTAALSLLEDDGRYLPLCGLFLFSATLTKNEGLMLALAVAVAYVASSRLRRPLLAVGVVAAPLAAHALWKLWLTRHAVPPNPFYDLADALHPGYLLARVDRLTYATERFLEQLLATGNWLLLVPSALALAALLARRIPAVAAFTANVVVMMVAGFLTVYWLSPVDLHFYVDNTVDRLPAFVAVFCGVLLPLLLGEAAREGEDG